MVSTQLSEQEQDAWIEKAKTQAVSHTEVSLWLQMMWTKWIQEWRESRQEGRRDWRQDRRRSWSREDHKGLLLPLWPKRGSRPEARHETAVHQDRNPIIHVSRGDTKPPGETAAHNLALRLGNVDLCLGCRAGFREHTMASVETPFFGRKNSCTSGEG